jgi:hypothetical protein
LILLCALLFSSLSSVILFSSLCPLLLLSLCPLWSSFFSFFQKAIREEKRITEDTERRGEHREKRRREHREGRSFFKLPHIALQDNS